MVESKDRYKCWKPESGLLILSTNSYSQSWLLGYLLRFSWLLFQVSRSCCLSPKLFLSTVEQSIARKKCANHRSHLTNTDCNDSLLTDCTIKDTHMRGTTCSRSKIESTTFDWSTATGSNIQGSWLYSSTTIRSNIKNAKLISATVTETRVDSNSECYIRDCTIIKGVPTSGCKISRDCTITSV